MPVPPSLTLRGRRMGRIRPQLDGLREVLTQLGDPQQSFPSILVVGTNGKGSTAAMLDAVLRAHGLATGLFTSPHLVRVEERIRLSGEMVDEAVLNRHLEGLAGFADLTYFETLTAAAFTVFADAGVDVAVLEAGMGGSWDATRLAESPIAGLTNVGSDHRAWLGSKRAQIARDKGQALAAAKFAVLGPGVAEDLRLHLEAPQAVPAEELLSVSRGNLGGVRLSWDSREFEITQPLVGAHQVENLQLALALARCACESGLLGPLEPNIIRSALERLDWPGRLSEHSIGGRTVLVDCAHNEEAACALARYLEGLGRRFDLLFSCLDDKPVLRMAEALRPQVAQVAVCPLSDERAMPIERLLEAFPDARAATTPIAGLESLDDPVLAAGSVRLVGELLSHSSGSAGW